LLLVLGATLCAPAHGAEAYLFLDENGVQVISNAIPPHLARKGYRVIDSETLRTLRVVPPEATPAADAVAAAVPAPQERARGRTDEQLLELYGTVEDVTAARDRKLHDLGAEIERVVSQMETDARQKRKLESEAAERERSGLDNAALNESIEALEQRLANAESDLERRRREQQIAANDFAYEIERMECLTGRASGTTCAPESGPH
jgi:septal ring factor EnvC (AmiA/AmiB activator)